MSLPAADDLFRPTGPAVAPAPEPQPEPEPVQDGATGGSRRPSGRVRHDEKMTVYVTAEELLRIEQARLTLRSAHGLAVDRGRVVREAIGLVLAELDERGEDSELVRRLREG